MYLRPISVFPFQKKMKVSNYKTASAGNRTRVNCLEGSYAHHYTTDALILAPGMKFECICQCLCLKFVSISI